MRHYAATLNPSHAAVIFVGGAGGGWDTPVRGSLYPRLASELPPEGLHAMRLKYRIPNDLVECVLDLLVAIARLETLGIEKIGLVGHSFGGAVIIETAAQCERVIACAPLSTQTYGAESVSRLGPRCALFFGHGTADEILPDWCSRSLYAKAREPKELHLKQGARHGLDEWSDELPSLLKNFLVARLKS